MNIVILLPEKYEQCDIVSTNSFEILSLCTLHLHGIHITFIYEVYMAC